MLVGGVRWRRDGRILVSMKRTFGPTLISRVGIGVLLAALGAPVALSAQDVREAAPAAARQPITQVADTSFRHAAHRDFGCLDCHTMQASHGTLLVRSTADCRDCHHTGERVEQGCERCHEPAEIANVVALVRRVFTLTVRDDAIDRELVFDHADHVERACAECHREGPSFAERTLDCEGCHEEHHDPGALSCQRCHGDPPVDAHPPDVHTTCAGSGCHVDAPFEASPRTRVGCLWCHDEQVDHEPEGDCVDCHFVSGSLPVHNSVR